MQLQMLFFLNFPSLIDIFYQSTFLLADWTRAIWLSEHVDHGTVGTNPCTGPKKMATGTFTHNSSRMKTLKLLIKTRRKVL